MRWFLLPVVLLALLACGCNTPMDASPLPAARPSQLSAPALFESDASAARVFFLDGPLLKAYYASGGLIWSVEAGYFWNPQPVVGRGGTAYVITYDPDFPPDRPNYVLRAFADGVELASFPLNQQPTRPLVLRDGTLVLGLRSTASGPRPVSAEPPGSKLLALTPELEVAWSSTVPADLLRTPVADATRVYAADAANLHVFDYAGNLVGSMPFTDPAQSAQLVAGPDSCYILNGAQLTRMDGVTQVWAVTLPAAGMPDGLYADANGAYCLLAGGVVYAAAAADGSRRWSRQLRPGIKHRLALAPDGDMVYAASGGGEAGAEDVVLGMRSSDGDIQWQYELNARITAPLRATAEGVLAIVSRPRATERGTLIYLRDGGLESFVAAAVEVLPGFVVNGQSTLNPPWPALQ